MDRYLIIAEYCHTPPRIITRNDETEIEKWWSIELDDMRFVNRISMYEIRNNVICLIKTHTGDKS